MTTRARSVSAKKARAAKRKGIMRAELTAADAEQRRIVRLPDGRTGRLLSVDPSKAGRSKGTKARVVLGSGAVLSVPLEELVPFVGPTTKVCTRCGVREAVPCFEMCRACRYYSRTELA